eukprot:scaffold56230_cov51-Phaeocystis_antarctica.AAC.1
MSHLSIYPYTANAHARARARAHAHAYMHAHVYTIFHLERLVNGDENRWLARLGSRLYGSCLVVHTDILEDLPTGYGVED